LATLQVSFNYFFASEEYNEYVGTLYNDVFGFELNGVYIALLPGGTTSVAINNVNSGVNSQYYINNDGGAYQTQADGFTTTLQANGIQLSTNHIKIAVADVGDSHWDSWVFLEGGTFRCIDSMCDPPCVGPCLTGTCTGNVCDIVTPGTECNDFDENNCNDMCTATSTCSGSACECDPANNGGCSAPTPQCIDNGINPNTCEVCVPLGKSALTMVSTKTFVNVIPLMMVAAVP
jgi:hypothetical protein